MADNAEAPAPVQSLPGQLGAAHPLGDPHPLSFALGSPRGRQVSRGKQVVPGGSNSALPPWIHAGFSPNINNALDS